MKITYDPTADILYLELRDDPLGTSVDIAPGVTLERTETGEPAGIEVLDFTKHVEILEDDQPAPAQLPTIDAVLAAIAGMGQHDLAQTLITPTTIEAFAAGVAESLAVLAAEMGDMQTHLAEAMEAAKPALRLMEAMTTPRGKQTA